MLISKFSNFNVEQMISNVERKYGITLPSQYKNFLYKYNGGYTPKTKFRVGRISSDIRGFFGVGDVKLNLESLELDDWIRQKFFPIACDSFCNYIVIGLCGDDAGKIFFCDHERGTKIEYITEDLNTFFAACQSNQISEASRSTIKEREEALIAKGKGHIITDDLREIWQAEIDKYGSMIQEDVLLD